MWERVRRGGLYETIKADGSIVTLKAVFSGGAVGLRMGRGGLYETIKESENIVTLKAVFGCGQWVSGRGAEDFVRPLRRAATL